MIRMAAGPAYALPGTPQPAYLTGATLGAITGATAAHASDLSMADTSQAVSRTPAALYPLHPFGIVGVIPFTYVKGYDSAPDAASGRLTNVPVNAAYNNLIIGDAYNASNYTGNTADASDGVVMVGRNFRFLRKNVGAPTKIPLQTQLSGAGGARVRCSG